MSGKQRAIVKLPKNILKWKQGEVNTIGNECETAHKIEQRHQTSVETPWKRCK